jgi:hypothetical protein
MAYIVADRVKETTIVTGTGQAALLGAVSGYRSFASVMLSIGDTCAYAIVNANASEWEVGIGTYSAVNTLARTTIHASTNANAAVVFSAGTKDVFMGPTANTVLSNVTSTDGTVTLSKTGSIVDLSVAVAAAATNVVVQVRNNTGATLTKGTVVYINDAIGQLPTVAKAIATSDATSAQTLGMISADLANNSNGYVTIIGLISNINTSAYVDGDQLYLSGTTAGTFTKVKPYAPTHLVYVGIVEHAHVTQGKIFVKVQNGYEMDELHNVDAYNPSNGDLLIYNTSTNLWTHSPQSNLTVATSQITGTLPVANGGTGVTTATGSGSVVLSTTPTLVTPQTNSLSAVPVGSGAGNSLTLAAGSGVGTGGGGSLVLQAGIQATSGNDGKVVVKQVAGQTSNLQEWQNSAGTAVAFADSIGNIGARSFFLKTNGDIRGPYFFGDNNPTFVLSAANPAFLQLGSNGYIGWTSSANNANVAADTIVYKDAAGVLAQRNGTNPQAFRIYNTYTDASNYERLGITWSSSICTIGLAQAGTGLIRTLNVNANALNAPALPVAATVTAATGNGTTVTYTCASTFAIGQVVSITGLTITTGSSLNLSNQTITGVTTTAFTVTNATVGTAAATQAGTATIQSAGNSVNITAGSGSGVGAGGNVILQPGAQGSSGGNGWVKFYDVTGANTRMGAWNNSTQGYGFGWDTQNNGTLGTGLVSSSVNGTGYIGVKSQTANHFMIETNNGTTALLTNSANTQSRLIFVNGNNAQTTSGSAGICSYTTGVITIRDGGTSIAGGSLSFPSTTTAFSANTNDLPLTASGFQRINCTSAASLTGIAPPSGGAHVDGRMVRVYNVGTANLTLAHNSASSTTGNKFFNSTGADIILGPNDYAELIYDATGNGLWRVS